MDCYLRKIRKNPKRLLKKWFLQKKRHKRKVLKNIIELLTYISGNDLENFINSLLTKLSPKKVFSKDRVALTNIIKHLNLRVKPKQKHYYLKAIRCAGFIRRFDVKKLGFKFSSWLWDKCLESRERNLGGRPNIGNLMISNITKHLEDFSEIAGSRTTTQFIKAPRLRKPNGTIYTKKFDSQKIIENSRYMNISIMDAYKCFGYLENKEREPGIFSLAPCLRTFHYYVNRKFKKPRQLLDLCNF